jgi:glycosyltransferase involved in cell wall biosynthesis
MKLFEYLASGRPILASQLPVLREVLNDQNAILLPGDDVGAWAAALQSLATDAGARERLGAAARHSAQGYSWQARAAAILDGLG